ncbi:exodeoxyribonuclease VII large subunit [Lentilactobacillus sp. Marseille-Q4993]|uniref:exodeoxyribonuclease VII large subunit n=1 Tax=Lentilactobacillus sp. Marseille-Q4993 TaxID=3039492 RepID=UPI0024BD3133|nr:exodeoxyribonuclease VII large subunit [Lentilactobacillus sp. Marseille-Q4993]
MSNEYLTVSALTKYLKRKFDFDPYLSKVYLTGEISNFRLRPNAHQYFSLKDDNAKISAIMFKSAFSKIKFTPEEGMKVLVVGHISVYEPSGSYQIYVERMEPDGIGQLYQAYEQLKKKLATEGLFTRPKRPLIKYPKRIAVVTSPSGAVIRDIITTVRRRYPIAQIVLFPALVQGDQAAGDIVRQIERVNEIGNFDTLIVGRGGGSIEDLWPFNEEITARAIFDSKIPVISSVGHETDTTIADLVADMRAATPTAAAELAVPKYDQVLIEIKNNQTRLMNDMAQIIKQNDIRLTKLTGSVVFKSPERIYETYAQRLDLITQKLQSRIQNQVNGVANHFNQISTRLKLAAPTTRINETKSKLDMLKYKLIESETELVNNQKRQFELRVAALDHLSPLKILSRGYTYTTDENNKLIASINGLAGREINVHFADGTATAKVDRVDSNSDDE